MVVAGLAAGVAAGAGAPLAAQASRASPPPRWAAFTAAFDAYAREDGVVGGTVVVMRGGQVLARHAYGLGDREQRRPPGNEDVYHWASITKTLTAIAIMQLRDRGRLTLDDPVVRYVPELRQVHDRFGSIEGVTLRMLLSHSAGFQDPTWPYGEGRPWEPFEPTRWDQLVAMMPYQELRFAPGSRFGYSNPAFIYLARVIEAITGDAWAVYVQKNIWMPLGLTQSFVGVSPYHLADRRAKSYTVRAEGPARRRVVPNPREFDPGVTISNSGWNAPVSDLVAYVAFLSGAGRDDPRTAQRNEGVLTRTSLQEMWRPVVPLQPRAEGEKFGLAFYLFERGTSNLVGHTGEQSGFRSFFYLDPVTTTGVIGVLNTTNEARPEASARGWNALTHRAVDLVAP
ncbi:MAG TPA: serine hydrolase domain-containing protein [Gemmatimonadales bacterium]|nr:serine hydrolase domain-containing protein [Gemmatimonadales bacterium]